MKKTLILCAATLLTAIGANAQSSSARKSGASYISLGPVVSLGHSWMSDLGDGDAHFKFSPAAGIGLVYSRHEHWGFGGQLLASHEGFDKEIMLSNGQQTRFKLSADYLRMPLQVTYFFGHYGDRVRPKIYLGPSFALKLGESTQQSGATLNPDESNMLPSGVRDFDAGLNAGVGLNVRLHGATWLNLDAGYYHGLTDVLQDYGGSNTNRNLRLNAGLMWGL
jgi:hypothetical protein